MDNFIGLLIKPDNIPIVGMLFLSVFFGAWSFYLAFNNDRLKKNNKINKQPSKDPDKEIVDSLDVVYPSEEQGLTKKIHCWPYLVRLEFIAAILVIVGLIVWSILLDAPLEQPANPSITPNPAKAPWYFLGLQEMLVYFDPWIAGVILPTLIIIGLMAIPYVDTNPDRGNGYYSLSERLFPILTFWFGYFMLWVLLIIIGTFFRGPGWMWFWPWEKWDPHRVISETNVNLNEFLGQIIHMPVLAGENAGFITGFIVIAVYYILGFYVTYIIMKKKSGPKIEKTKLIRYLAVCFFFLTMMSLPIKMVLRLGWNIKYIWVTPWFNI